MKKPQISQINTVFRRRLRRLTLLFLPQSTPRAQSYLTQIHTAFARPAYLTRPILQTVFVRLAAVIVCRIPSDFADKSSKKHGLFHKNFGVDGWFENGVKLVEQRRRKSIAWLVFSVWYLL